LVAKKTQCLRDLATQPDEIGHSAADRATEKPASVAFANLFMLFGLALNAAAKSSNKEQYFYD